MKNVIDESIEKPETETVENKPIENKKNYTAIIVSVILLVITIGVVMYINNKKNKEKKETDNTDKTNQ